jgi:hypothetical protein
MTNAQIVNSFVKGATTGKNAQGSLFIEGDTLFSYGYHYPLAKRVEGGFWVNNEKYSRTTSKQASLVRGAIVKHGFSMV